MTPPLSSILRGESPEYVRRSESNTTNRATRIALAGYYADRGLLLFSFFWLVRRVQRYLVIRERPEILYEPASTWLAQLVYPQPPAAWFWYGLLTAAAVSLCICLVRPRALAARIALAVSLPLLILPEFGYGKIEHINHLFLTAHVYGVFLPIRRPDHTRDVKLQAEAVQWYQGGLLFIYTMSGLWKFADMTIRDLIKPGMTWLHPDALVVTSVTSMRGYDLSLAIPRVIETVGFLFPIGYVLLSFILAASAFAAFRRPLLLIVVPTIVLFHFLNAVSIYVLFISTIVVALILFLPYDLLVPGISRHLEAVQSTLFEGDGHNMHYTRRYANGDRDEFRGFYAYREQLRDRSLVLAAPLYYPGVAWIASQILVFRQPNHTRSEVENPERISASD